MTTETVYLLLAIAGEAGVIIAYLMRLDRRVTRVEAQTEFLVKRRRALDGGSDDAA